MKQQQDWHEHLSPASRRFAGMSLETSLFYPLMAVAIIAAVTGLVIALAGFGVLAATEVAESMLIGA
jgi:hypothetical protein